MSGLVEHNIVPLPFVRPAVAKIEDDFGGACLVFEDSFGELVFNGVRYLFITDVHTVIYVPIYHRPFSPIRNSLGTYSSFDASYLYVLQSVEVSHPILTLFPNLGQDFAFFKHLYSI